VAFMAALTRSVLAAAGSTLVLLLLSGVLGSAAQASRWLPTGLLGALADLTAGRSAGDYLPGLVVTLILIALALAGAVLLGDRREL
jgi:ABC-2 type transport system permease protein